MNVTIELRSPKGNPATLVHREGTSDLSTLGSTWELWGKLDDEYELQWLEPMTGMAVDIGAHIGSVTFALLADHPDLKVTAVEPLADNCRVMAETAALNGWTDRLTIIHGAIGAGETADIAYDFEGTDNLRNHRFIGGMKLGTEAVHQTETVPTVTLKSIVGKGSPFLKVDCEGCEWALFADKAIGKVQHIVGEGHPADWLERVHNALDKTHVVSVIHDEGGPGTFRAVHR